LMTASAFADLQTVLGRDLLAFLPELILCGAIVLMLLMRLVPFYDRMNLGWVALLLTASACFVSFGQWRGWLSYDPRMTAGTVGGAVPNSLEMFSGMLVYDNFTIFLRLFLFGFTALIIWLSLMTGIPDNEDSADYFSLLLGATVG